MFTFMNKQINDSQCIALSYLEVLNDHGEKHLKLINDFQFKLGLQLPRSF